MKMQLTSYLTIISGILILLINCISVHAQNWETNIEEAKSNATEFNRRILMVFQGSDWCAPCMKLDKYILSSDQFKTYAQSNLTMLKIDFPKRRKNRLPEEQKIHNSKLAKQYNTEGVFPYVVVLNTNGEVLGSLGYEGPDPELYIEKLNAILTL